MKNNKVKLRKMLVKFRKTRVKLRNNSVKLRKMLVKFRKTRVKLRNDRVKLRKMLVKFRKTRVKLRNVRVKYFIYLFRHFARSFRFLISISSHSKKQKIYFKERLLYFAIYE